MNLYMTDHCTTGFCLWQTICLVPVPCISSMCHMYMTDFAYDGPVFLVPLSPSYPSSPVYLGRAHTSYMRLAIIQADWGGGGGGGGEWKSTYLVYQVGYNTGWLGGGGNGRVHTSYIRLAIIQADSSLSMSSTWIEKRNKRDASGVKNLLYS